MRAIKQSCDLNSDREEDGEKEKAINETLKMHVKTCEQFRLLHLCMGKAVLELVLAMCACARVRKRKQFDDANSKVCEKEQRGKKCRHWLWCQNKNIIPEKWNFGDDE